MKLCIDCKYYKKGISFPQWGISGRDKCEHPEIVSPVDGRAEIECDVLRGEKGLCGEKGAWFEPKNYKAELDEALEKIKQLSEALDKTGKVIWVEPRSFWSRIF